MDEMRSEIRAAFEKEQMAHAPAASLRHNIVDAVSARPRQAPNFQWVAVAAAVLLGLLVVVGLMSTRFNHRASVPVTNPKASPVADYGPPPAGVPLLYVHDPSHPTWLIGYDWTGKPRGTVKLDPALAGVGMAPDGQSFAVGFGAKGGTGEILDRLGQPVQGVGGAIPGSALPIWADDNLHICGVSFDQTFAWTFITLTPGEAVKAVAVIAHDHNIGQTGIQLASCSFRNDQAILVRTATVSPSDVWVVQISTGKILSHNTYSNSGDLANVVGSGDAVLIAENSSKSNGVLQGPTAPSTIIRRVSDRSVVATLDPSMGVLAFSSDDSLVLVTTTPWVGGLPTQLAVIDLRSGQALWHYNGPDMFGSSVAQPGGRDFALVLKDPLTDKQTYGDLVIVHADGTATDFPRRYEPTW